jgi:hypothetical protein
VKKVVSRTTFHDHRKFREADYRAQHSDRFSALSGQPPPVRKKPRRLGDSERLDNSTQATSSVDPLGDKSVSGGAHVGDTVL